MFTTFSLALNFAGLLALAASLESHRHTFRAARLRNHPIGLRLLGSVFQVLALFTAVHAQGPVLGPCLWIIGWAICGFALTLLIARLRQP